VVVVNDGSSAAVNDVITLLGATHSNLHQTFVPVEACNLSRKKLAISLGIKCARHDNLILTTAACVPASADWLRLMARHFADGKEVVIGAAHISRLKGLMRRFDQVASATTWLSAALHGRPYRGTAFNIGYTRQLFFSAKGFSKSLNIQHGDDDLFINEIATAANTAVELDAGAQVSVETSRPAYEATEQKLSHTFTARFLPRRQARIMGASTAVMWLWVAATATAVVFTLPNAIGLCVLPFATAAVWVPLSRRWLRNATLLGMSLNGATVWLAMLWRWLYTLKARLRCNTADRQNFTWQK
ncbi:MAG: hypothetical protein K2O10_01785, partial [Muribaculaceae bacterium]|nr:hypothetical protein [Muribaculaceae bacterium]